MRTRVFRINLARHLDPGKFFLSGLYSHPVFCSSQLSDLDTVCSNRIRNSYIDSDTQVVNVTVQKFFLVLISNIMDNSIVLYVQEVWPHLI